MLLGAPITMSVDGAEPSTPAADQAALYARKYAGRSLLKFKGEDGVDNFLAYALWDKLVQAWLPAVSTTIQTIGGTLTNVGTISHPALDDTNDRGRTVRFRNTSAATAGSLASTRPSRTEFAMRKGAFFVERIGLATMVADQRFFTGCITTAASAPTNVDPLTSTSGGKFGLACNSNTGNWRFIHGAVGAAPTVIDLGASFPVNNTDLLELKVYIPDGGTTLRYYVRNITSGAETSGTVSTNLPAVTTSLGRQIWMCNNATASAVAWDCTRCVLETDT